MDATHCSPYPHYSWFAHRLAVLPPRIFDVHECRHVTHRIMLTIRGAADVRWTTRSTETVFHAAPGGIGFFPCDRAAHAMAITAADGFQAYDVLVPEEHLTHVSTAEGLRPAADFPAIPAFRDALLEASLLRLSTKADGQQLSEDVGDEIAARQILIRLCVRLGGGPPEWHRDTSVFTPLVMRQIVARIDAHLGTHGTLEIMAGTVGLSPGHFARKFQHSAGLSLDRFINKRRIGASFVLLRTGATPLSQIALDLGFSSQSHFTRLFSGLTGITPRQFRRLHGRMEH
jgi:AraC-like DNA-binding protein